jgi:ribosome-associated toxin RatA of RatAB toxin-antitoxin module
MQNIILTESPGMAEVRHQEVLEVSSDALYSVIIDYEKYPLFVEGCHQVKIESRTAHEARVVYYVNLLSYSLIYTLDHQEEPEKHRVSWSLIDSNFLKKNEGFWELKKLSQSQSEVVCFMGVEFKIPVPGFILKKLVKKNVPQMVQSFCNRSQIQA